MNLTPKSLKSECRNHQRFSDMMAAQYHSVALMYHEILYCEFDVQFERQFETQFERQSEDQFEGQFECQF